MPKISATHRVMEWLYVSHGSLRLNLKVKLFEARKTERSVMNISDDLRV